MLSERLVGHEDSLPGFGDMSVAGKDYRSPDKREPLVGHLMGRRLVHIGVGAGRVGGGHHLQR